MLRTVGSLKGALGEIKAVANAHGPGFFFGHFTGDAARNQSINKTLEHITDPRKFKELQTDAINNLERWEAESDELPLKVEVKDSDWGVAALEATKKYGKTYAVLNMANSYHPGGLVFEGGSAQEENIWHRTSCALTLLDDGVLLDKHNNVYYYDDETTLLVKGRTQLSSDELTLLSTLRNQKLTEANKVYLNQCPQICFRGPEFIIPRSAEHGKTSFFAEPSLSFHSLMQNNIFPFYELRSAAPNLHGESIDWEDPLFLKKYTKNIRMKVAAQLDTLILAGVPNVILGAWGCGSFGNNPDIVSNVYREEIEKRSESFQHIMFAILNSYDYSNKFQFFREQLHGLKLSYPKELASSITSAESVRENFSLSPMSVFEEATPNESETIAKRRD